jgi:hypothetical protein
VQRRTLLAACATVVIGGAGCTGTDGAGADGPSTTTEPRTTIPAERVVAYADLTPTQREAFERARTETVRFTAGSIPGISVDYDLRVFTPFREHAYVRKEGTYYALTTGRSGFISGTRVVVEPADDGGDGVSLDGREGEGIALLRRAIERENGTATATEVDPPEGVEAGDVVVHEGERYRIAQVSNRDYEYWTLDVERR